MIVSRDRRMKATKNYGDMEYSLSGNDVIGLVI